MYMCVPLRACINDITTSTLRVGKREVCADCTIEEVSFKSGTRTRRDAISLPALLFFRSYNEVFVQTAFIPYYLSTDIDFVCVLCTSSPTAAVASLLSL